MKWIRQEKPSFIMWSRMFLQPRIQDDVHILKINFLFPFSLSAVSACLIRHPPPNVLNEQSCNLR